MYNKIINTLDDKDSDYRNNVLELKIDRDDEDQIKEFPTLFPFRMSKNSKYIWGIQSTLY